MFKNVPDDKAGGQATKCYTPKDLTCVPEVGADIRQYVFEPSSPTYNRVTGWAESAKQRACRRATHIKQRSVQSFRHKEMML